MAICMTLHTGFDNPETDYYMENRYIQGRLRFNRVTFDKDLKFRFHISNSVNKANGTVGFNKNNLCIIGPKIKLQIV